MKILVTGGRDYDNESCVNETLDAFNLSWPISLIVHGNAKGADSLAGAWADARDIPHTREKYTAAWRDLHAPGAWIKQGKHGAYNANAGKDRNQRMLDEEKPEVVIAFPGGTGTADMVMRAERAKVHVIRVA